MASHEQLGFDVMPPTTTARYHDTITPYEGRVRKMKHCQKDCWVTVLPELEASRPPRHHATTKANLINISVPILSRFAHKAFFCVLDLSLTATTDQATIYIWKQLTKTQLSSMGLEIADYCIDKTTSM